MERATPAHRLAWLDITKGLAILCTIVGHTVAYGGHVKTLIFSFHIPLFFLLSGYTTKEVKRGQLAKATWKDFKRLYLPVLLMRFLTFLYEVIFQGVSIPYSAWDNIRRILYGNGNDHVLLDKLPMFGVGVLWFLVAMFWAKLGYRLCLRYIKHYRFMFLLMGTFCSMWIGTHVWLPQSMDLIFLCMLFMEGGYQLRHSGLEGSKALQISGVVAFFVWIYFVWNKGILISMATRLYPSFILCIVVAFAGCLAVIQFCKSLEGLRSSTLLSFLGRHSLELLCIHHMDFRITLWDITTFNPNGALGPLNPILTSVYRILLDVAVLLVYLGVKKLLVRILQKPSLSASV